MKIIASLILVLGLYLCTSVILFPWTTHAKLEPFIGTEISTELWFLIYQKVAFILISQFLAGLAVIASGVLLFKSNKFGAHLWLVTCVAFTAASGYDAYTKKPDLTLIIGISIFCIIVMLLSFLVFRVCGIYPNPSIKRDLLPQAPYVKR